MAKVNKLTTNGTTYELQDYALNASLSGITGIVKSSSGTLSKAVAGTDYDYPVIKGTTAPTTSTAGVVGQRYINTTATADNGLAAEYVCTNVSSGVYTWVGAGAGSATLDVIANAYDSTATYAIGDVVIYSGGLYKCTTTISTAEAWTASHWTATTVSDMLSSLQATNDNKVSKSGDTMTGDLTLQKNFPIITLSSGTNNPQGVCRIQKQANATNDYSSKFTDIDANGNSLTIIVNSQSGLIQRAYTPKGGTTMYSNLIHEANLHLLFPSAVGRYGTQMYGAGRTSIPSDSDLNNYVAVGGYKCTSNAIAETISNSPTNGNAFIMDVIPSTGAEYDSLTDNSYMYMLQLLTEIKGKQWYRHVSNNNNNIKYHEWTQIYDSQTISSGTSELISGTSSLQSGYIYLQYE